MSKRQLKLYLTDIDDAISAIQSSCKGMTNEQLARDRKTREAIILNLVVMGEAIKKLPPEITRLHPGIPWKEFAGMRDKLVHEHFQISSLILWETIRQDLPPPASAVRKLLQEYA